VTSTERKLNSERKLASLGIVLIDNLPPIEDEHDVNLKTAQQIAKRILILSYLNCVTFDPSLQQEVMMFLIRERLWGDASVREKAFFHKPTLSEDEAAEIQWRAESIWLMLWAINKVDTLELPSGEVKPEDIFPFLPGFFENTDDFIYTAKTRIHSEVLDEADFTFRLNWTIREASVRKQAIPGINESVAYERYLALSWITGLTDQWQD
jgi:hypothetical protein